MNIVNSGNYENIIKIIRLVKPFCYCLANFLERKCMRIMIMNMGKYLLNKI